MSKLCGVLEINRAQKQDKSIEKEIGKVTKDLE